MAKYLVNCASAPDGGVRTANLVPAFKEKYPQKFRYGGNRSIDFEFDDEVPVRELKRCIALALTYHRNKKLPATTRWKMVDEVA
jgi:hypothetical protein